MKYFYFIFLSLYIYNSVYPKFCQRYKKRGQPMKSDTLNLSLKTIIKEWNILRKNCLQLN